LPGLLFVVGAAHVAKDKGAGRRGRENYSTLAEAEAAREAIQEKTKGFSRY